MTIASTSSPESAKLIKDFLQTHHSGVLATADTSAIPSAATVYCTTDDDFRLLFATKTKTQKYKNILHNNHVAFVCYDEASQVTVQIKGYAEIVEDESDEYMTALSAMYKYTATLSKTVLPPVEKLYAGDYKVLRIIPSVIKMAIFLRPDSEGIDMYETITFKEEA